MKIFVNKKPLLIFLAVLMKPLFVLAQEQLSDTIIYPIGHYETLNSRVLSEKRTIVVHLPDDYATQLKRYPVIFILDGEDTNRFHQSICAITFYSGVRRLPRMIVVGILNTDRTRDMTPGKVAQRDNSGGGELFLDFIFSELQPYIEKKYRTAPFRILFGCSSAGMLTLYTLFNRSDLFDAYIASRPALNSIASYTWDSDIIFNSASRLLNDRSSLKKSLYIDYGSQEDALHDPAPIHQLLSLFRSKAPKDFIFDIREMAEGGYRSAESLKNGLIAIFDSWYYPADSLFINGFKGIEIHARRMSEQFGYPITVSDLLGEMDFVIFGHRFIENNIITEAINLFKYAVTVYSDSWILYDSLAEAYIKNGQKNLAIENYTKSLELNPNSTNAIEMLNKIDKK